MSRASELKKKQVLFTQMVAKLITYAYKQEGYSITFGEAWRHPKRAGGHPRSLHKSRLAIDINLFINGKYQRSTKAHEKLGIYWEKLGGTWGGRFSKPDGNHYSLAHGGMK